MNRKTKILVYIGIILLLITTVGCQDNSLSTNNSLTKPESNSLDAPEGIPTENPETNCSAVNPHPVAEGMTENFNITYDEVMILYCDGYAFSDILLALETSEMVDQDPAALLARLRTRSWQEIWDEFGIDLD